MLLKRWLILKLLGFVVHYGFLCYAQFFLCYTYKFIFCTTRIIFFHIPVWSLFKTFVFCLQYCYSCTCFFEVQQALKERKEDDDCRTGE